MQTIQPRQNYLVIGRFVKQPSLHHMPCMQSTQQAVYIKKVLIPFRLTSVAGTGLCTQLHSDGLPIKHRCSLITRVITTEADLPTLEVTSIARTLARSLSLNEDLVKHSLFATTSDPPLGHAGEDTLDELLRDHGGLTIIAKLFES